MKYVYEVNWMYTKILYSSKRKAIAVCIAKVSSSDEIIYQDNRSAGGEVHGTNSICEWVRKELN